MEKNMQIIDWEIDKLISAEYNPRKLSEEQKQTIKDSINRFGLVDPVIVNTNKDRFGIIIGGHQRTKVARELGFKKMPCVELDLTLDQEKELNVRLNKNTGDFDKDLLVEFFDQEDLIEWGFENEYFEDVVTEIDSPDEEDFNGEIPTEPQTVLGDLYELNGHRVHCASSTEIDAVEKLMDGKKADMVFTDPPYGMSLDADYSKIGNDNFKPGRKHENIIADEEDFDASFIFSIFDYCQDIVLFGADYYSDSIPNKKDGSWLIWDKREEERFDKIIGSAFETIYSKRKVKRQIIRHEYVSWSSRMEDKVNGTKPHPTMKPVKMLCKLLNIFKGFFIVDLFLGSGSTLIASEQLDRKCYGQELDPKYCDVIIKRWVKYMDDNNRKFTVKRNGEDITKNEWLYE